jgi:ERF superfamily
MNAITGHQAGSGEFRTSPTIGKLAAALARAKAAFRPIGKDGYVKTEKYKFHYATLGEIIDATLPALTENGLVVVQAIVMPEGRPALVTSLLHESGEWLEGCAPVITQATGPQAFGSAVTYQRRYSYSALLGIVADEDDDGAQAAGHAGHTVQRRPPSRAPALGERTPSNAEDVARSLINRARSAEGVDEGHSLLEAYLQRASALEGLRGTKAWDALEHEMGAGLKRSLGTEPAAAFVSALRMSEAAHIAAVQQKWEGQWHETLAAMQQESPATYAMLRRHVAAQIARVRAATGAEGPEKPKQEAAAFRAAVKDAKDEAATGDFTDPVAWAEAYAEVWKDTFPIDRAALARHNVKTLGQAAKVVEARRIIDALQAEYIGRKEGQD